MPTWTICLSYTKIYLKIGKVFLMRSSFTDNLILISSETVSVWRKCIYNIFRNIYVSWTWLNKLWEWKLFCDLLMLPWHASFFVKWKIWWQSNFWSFLSDIISGFCQFEWTKMYLSLCFFHLFISSFTYSCISFQKNFWRIKFLTSFYLKLIFFLQIFLSVFFNKINFSLESKLNKTLKI
jgi:hypothetical protein